MDQRILSFLTVCKTMNYRRAAQTLHITQPAVTQHIQSLEREYGVRLFHYDGKVLSKTEQADILQRYAISMNYNYGAVKRELKGQSLHLRIGATKTIADFVIAQRAAHFLANPEHTLSIVADNTTRLLSLLDENQLDFAIIEGPFRRRDYGWRLFQRVPFVGICAASHPFAGRVISMEELLSQTLLVREEGSGTRLLFEQQLAGLSYSLADFPCVNSIGSFSLLKQLVAAGLGVTFAYRSILTDSDALSWFSLSSAPPEYEYNIVYLKDTCAEELAQLFCGDDLV